MRILVFLLTLVLTQATSGEVAPESILGSWYFDLSRTMSEHIVRVAPNRPEGVDIADLESLKKSYADLAQKEDRQVIITFTEDAMISTNTWSTTTSFPYTVIGGNVGVVMIEYTDDDGYQSVAKIRLVEGGIAMETTDCRSMPQQCERERERATKQINQKKKAIARKTDQNGDTAIYVVSGNKKPTKMLSDDAARIKLVYFKRLPQEE